MNTPDVLALDDNQYPKVGFGVEGDLPVNDAQATSLFRKWKQSQFPESTSNQSWAEFAKTVKPTFGMDGAVIVQWAGMWLAIETDGYTHS